MRCVKFSNHSVPHSESSSSLSAARRRSSARMAFDRLRFGMKDDDDCEGVGEEMVLDLRLKDCLRGLLAHVNRSAKLKQFKLDARREQWLSQGKNKGLKEDWEPGQRREQGSDQSLEKLGVNRARDEENGGSFHQFSDSESSSNSPTSTTGVFGANHSVNKCIGSCTTSSTFSCVSSVGCCSGSTTEVDEGDDECLDDWEAMADALAANDKPPQNQPLGDVLEIDNSIHPNSHGPMSPESNNLGIEQSERAHGPEQKGNRAWIADDVSRPPSLPNLSKQCSLPITARQCGNGGILWGRIPSAPSSCPICFEDLDKTDSSFLPCLCGFRLCLFCHKQILEEDGRCPGCRQPYQPDPVEAEPSLHGGSLILRLARSYSMNWGEVGDRQLILLHWDAHYLPVSRIEIGGRDVRFSRGGVGNVNGGS
ncbi:hypothetical protein MLD38_021835 [Melastoma candidum]|uniref:Uncharacterized protein n=1 Tax=Melastoma candidum TaxID=119954 RepID=A0ACB9QGP5_9MYRT|nr:hypothetical protein MLD38_021835 [Melastoma candidum]